MAENIAVEKDKSVLLLVDIQPDFMPGGALPTVQGGAIIEPVRDLMQSNYFRHFAATQDWHPRGHVSFASSHPGRTSFDTIELYGHEQTLWPDHCVQDTPGAELHPALPWRNIAVLIRKGIDEAIDSYSGFRNNWDGSGQRPPTGLAGYLRERNIESIFICGLARDVCVKWTAEDAIATGFRVWLLWDLTRPVDASTDAKVREDLQSRGIRIISSGQLVAA
ncbi:MAG: nicotinamidase [Gammaproteobacteria bacterium]|jgi:nicotinamidase/pyrazinamidase